MCVRVIHDTAKKEVALFQTIPLLRGMEIIILHSRIFRDVFHCMPLLLASGVCWTSFKS